MVLVMKLFKLLKSIAWATPFQISENFVRGDPCDANYRTLQNGKIVSKNTIETLIILHLTVGSRGFDPAVPIHEIIELFYIG